MDEAARHPDFMQVFGDPYPAMRRLGGFPRPIGDAITVGPLRRFMRHQGHQHFRRIGVDIPDAALAGQVRAFGDEPLKARAQVMRDDIVTRRPEGLRAQAAALRHTCGFIEKGGNNERPFDQPLRHSFRPAAGLRPAEQVQSAMNQRQPIFQGKMSQAQHVINRQKNLPIQAYRLKGQAICGVATSRTGIDPPDPCPRRSRP